MELRLGKKAGQLQDFVGPAQSLVLTLQRLSAVTRLAGDSVAQPAVNVLLANPFMQRLGNSGDLGCN